MSSIRFSFVIALVAMVGLSWARCIHKRQWFHYSANWKCKSGEHQHRDDLAF